MALLLPLVTLALLSAAPDSTNTKPLGELIASLFPTAKGGSKPLAPNSLALVVTKDSLWLAPSNDPNTKAERVHRFPKGSTWLEEVDWKITDLSLALANLRQKHPDVNNHTLLYASPDISPAVLERVVFNLHRRKFQVGQVHVNNGRLAWRALPHKGNATSGLSSAPGPLSGAPLSGPNAQGGLGGDGLMKPVVLGSLSKSVIRQVIRGAQPRVRYCYEKELHKNPGLQGKLVVRFIVSPSGVVQSANTTSSTMHNPAVEDCLSNVILDLTFPKPKGGGIVIVTYPFVFKTSK